MPPKIDSRQYKIAGELRRSQILTSFGAGAIVDMPRLSGIMAGIDSWDIKRLPNARIYERNLEKLLGKDFFFQASSPETESGNTFALRAYRFPIWYYCPECHHLDEYQKIAKSVSNASEHNSMLICNNHTHGTKSEKLIPSRFVVACRNGHIEDFPYIWWVHRSKGICNKPRLKLTYEGTTGNLGSIHIRCECGAFTTMQGCMDENSLRGFKCEGNSPWLGLSGGSWYKDPLPCKAKLRVLQRSANNVYYPINHSALTIPPWNAKIESVLSSNVGRFKFIFEQNDDLKKTFLKKEYADNCDEYACDEDTFIKEAYRCYGKKDIHDENISEVSIHCDEYKAFCGEDKSEDYFETETVSVPDDFAIFFSKIKMVKRLREVMVLEGFKRIDPVTVKDEDERKTIGINKEFAPISEKPLKWLPAIELFGEGIFLQFNEETVKKWEELNDTYYERMSRKLDPDWDVGKMFNHRKPRFVLLHTFAHLLIKQLTAQCGYATASIRERIYSTFNNSDEEMCGILIYTSATDTDGSLGGLVREGASARMNHTIKGLLEEASWCSNDPICIESKSQGTSGLNFASCHACTLLPETSCTHFNCLLDRASITGLPDSDNIDIAFFKKFITG